MKRSKGYIISYTARPQTNGEWIIGNLSFARCGYFWQNLFPSEKWIIREIKKGSPEFVQIVVTNIIELSPMNFKSWRRLGYDHR